MVSTVCSRARENTPYLPSSVVITSFTIRASVSIENDVMTTEDGKFGVFSRENTPYLPSSVVITSFSMLTDARIVNDVMTTEDGKYGVFSLAREHTVLTILGRHYVVHDTGVRQHRVHDLGARGIADVDGVDAIGDGRHVEALPRRMDPHLGRAVLDRQVCQDVDAARHAALLHPHDGVGALPTETRGDRVQPGRLSHERSRGVDLGDGRPPLAARRHRPLDGDIRDRTALGVFRAHGEADHVTRTDSARRGLDREPGDGVGDDLYGELATPLPGSRS